MNQPLSFAAPAMRLGDRQRLDWLQLIRSENVGPRTFRALLNRYGGAGAALEALPDLARNASGRTIRIADAGECAREMESVARLGGQFIALGEPDYPPALRMIEAAPPLIVVRGNAALLQKPMVAIVGSRNASAGGLAFAERIAREIGVAGFGLVSGLARGIDARVHRATLATGTVAVLAGGLDRIYPSEHEAFLEDIIAQGGVALTEMPVGWEPRGRDFPRRNRLVSGLSLATIVVEAARRSGSLITAKFALEQGREVFAVAGSPLDPRAEGTNDLIREGASMCTRAADVIEALAPLVRDGAVVDNLLREETASAETELLWDETDLFGTPQIPSTLAGHELDEVATQPISPGVAQRSSPTRSEGDSAGQGPGGGDTRSLVVELLGPSPVPVDDLLRAIQRPVAEVQMVLLELELAGRLERHGGGLVSLIV